MSRRNLLTGLVVAVVSAMPGFLSAQEAVLTGTVEDESGQPVASAVIEIAELDLRALSNTEGVYELTVPGGQVEGQSETLTVSSIGYRTIEETVTLESGTHTHDFVLESEALALDELLVTGVAGRQERRAQAASIASIDADGMAETQPVTSVAQVLQASAPGLTLREQSGSAGTAETIRIRGRSSISLGNAPLVYIDGVRMHTSNQTFGGVGGQSHSRLNDLRPEDIESIEIVKGPSAATLYGSDATAGVIQIFTRRGEAGQEFTQTVSTTYGQSDPAFTPPANFARCSEGHIDAGIPACQGLEPGTVISDNPLERVGAFETGHMGGITWSLRGGGEDYGVYLSAGVDDEQGTLPNNEYQRANLRANFDFMPSDNLRVDVSSGLYRTEVALPHNDNNIYGYLGGGFLGNPLTVGLDARDGWYAGNRQMDAISSIDNTDVTYRFMPNVQVNYTPRAWFSNRLTVGADMTRTEGGQHWPRNDQGWYDSEQLNTGQVTRQRQNRNQVTIDYLGNIQQDLTESLSADISFGSQVEYRRTDNTWSQGWGLVSNEVWTVSSAAENQGGQGYSEERQVGFLGQLQFSLWDRLYPRVSGRVDQHSAFGADTDPFFSPAVGLAYVISDEDFWQDRVDRRFVSDMRLRSSYGTTGRSPSTGSRATFSPDVYALQTGETAIGVSPDDPGNPDLKPERGTEFEIGFEAGLWYDRVGLEVNYFRQTTEDLILSTPLPPSLGFGSNPLRNIGSAQNTGIEVSANAQLVSTPNFAWEADVGFNTLNSEILDLGDVAPLRGSSTKYLEGHPMQARFHHEMVDMEPNPDYPESSSRPYRAIVTDTMVYRGNHNNQPGYEGNLGNTFTFLGGAVSLYSQLNFRGDYVLFNSTAQFRERQMGSGERFIRQEEILDDWERAERFGPWITESGESVGQGRANSAYLEDGDFIRLRELALNIRVPDQWVQEYLPAQGANISLSGRNLYTRTDYSGLDPESGQFLTVPSDKRYIARVNLQF